MAKKHTRTESNRTQNNKTDESHKNKQQQKHLRQLLSDYDVNAHFLCTHKYVCMYTLCTNHLLVSIIYIGGNCNCTSSIDRWCDNSDETLHNAKHTTCENDQRI